MNLLRRAARYCAATTHRSVGIAWFYCRAFDRARRRFERVLELQGDDFTSYVYLGRLAYGVGDYAGWRRECELARQTSPARFAKLDHPFALHRPRPLRSDDLLGDVDFEDPSARASWRLWDEDRRGDDEPTEIHSRPRRQGRWSDPAGAPWFAEAAGAGLDEDPAGLDGLLRARDDFSSTAERAKFRQLEPLRPSEIASVDLDELARRL